MKLRFDQSAIKVCSKNEVISFLSLKKMNDRTSSQRYRVKIYRWLQKNIICSQSNQPIISFPQKAIFRFALQNCHDI
jgi:hypothetical protein